ncbi:uncharacterized protein LOC123678195 isoform X2 [Harmonia axyridis]|nr:uncharacterized protein LOC123678195 isoform X2 [Harmonia axyridis]
MGKICSKKSNEIPTLQRLRYDMSSLNLPNSTFIWFLGLPGSGRKTHAHLLCEKLGLIEINVVEILRNESKKDTDRGKKLSQLFKGQIKKVADELVVDLIKEGLLLSSVGRTDRNFVINNFPRSKKQAKLFIQEIKDVDVIIYLFADMVTLINRIQEQNIEKPLDVDILKKKIVLYAKEVREALSGMKTKIEKECVTFARERNGLAFNFSPSEDSKTIKSKIRSIANCQILGCPELGNSTTLIPDENFDYYSAFGNMNTTSNATCISSTGVFTIIKDKGNYTDSITKCQNLGADLADVLTETRTKQLASLVNSTVGSWYKASYVGLDDLQSKGLFESSNGNHIYCTKYRAWGPGHPRIKKENYNCVTLHSDRTWEVVPCNVELTAI